MLNKDNKFWFDKDSNETMTGTLTADFVALPLAQNVKWNPDEYKITKIDTENGIIEFDKIKDE